MPTCPKGHNSTATDYCDECGAPMPAGSAAGVAEAPGAPSAPSAAAASPAAAPSAAPSSAAASSAAGETCPECGTARDGRFCEVCGHDFLATPSPAPNGSAAAPASPAGSIPDPAAASAPAAPIAAAAPASTGTAGAPASAGTPEWRVVATADKAYYDRMRATADADAEPVAFPAFCPQRRFVLAGPQVLIGRHSRSRGIEPGIDLTGPPEDAGVSHSHALLVAGADGTWCVVDLDSANGTYLNDATDPLPPNQPTMLASGDQIHLGAWTTLTVTTA